MSEESSENVLLLAKLASELSSSMGGLGRYRTGLRLNSTCTRSADQPTHGTEESRHFGLLSLPGLAGNKYCGSGRAEGSEGDCQPPPAGTKLTTGGGKGNSCLSAQVRAEEEDARELAEWPVGGEQEGLGPFSGDLAVTASTWGSGRTRGTCDASG